MSLKIPSFMASLIPNETSTLITASIFFSLMALQSHGIIDLTAHSIQARSAEKTRPQLSYTQPRSSHPALSQSAHWASPLHSGSTPHRSLSPHTTSAHSSHRHSRYVSRPQTLSAVIFLSHQHDAARQCQGVMIHPRVTLTAGRCARKLSNERWYLVGRAERSVSAAGSASKALVVKSVVHPQGMFALHVLSAPLSIAPVYLSEVPSMIGDDFTSPYIDDVGHDEVNELKALAGHDPVRHSIYGAFVVSRPHRNSALQRLSALYINQQIKVLKTSDRAWMQDHLSQFSRL